MHFDEANNEWTVAGTNLATGNSTILKLSKEKLGNYSFDWAMLVCETIKNDGACNQLPADANGVTFSHVEVDGAPITWTKRENMGDCKEHVTSNAGGDTVKMSWSFANSTPAANVHSRQQQALAAAI